MSICIAIAIPDGIALAADSQTTWNQTITSVREKDTGKEIVLEKPLSIPVSWSKMARKLFPISISDKNYAVCIAGMALINRKTIFSIFKSLESSFPEGLDINFDAVADYFCKGLETELKKQLVVESLSTAPLGNVIEFILTGFDDKDVSKPRIETWLVFSGNMNVEDDGRVVQTVDTKYLKWKNLNNSIHDLGGCWIGRSEFISHILSHGNEQLPAIQGQYELLSLSDAVDYTKFLVNFTCDFQRFAIMVPDCGKPIISATLTPSGYQENIINE